MGTPRRWRDASEGAVPAAGSSLAARLEAGGLRSCTDAGTLGPLQRHRCIGTICSLERCSPDRILLIGALTQLSVPMCHPPIEAALCPINIRLSIHWDALYSSFPGHWSPLLGWCLRNLIAGSFRGRDLNAIDGYVEEMKAVGILPCDRSSSTYPGTSAGASDALHLDVWKQLKRDTKTRRTRFLIVAQGAPLKTASTPP